MQPHFSRQYPHRPRAAAAPRAKIAGIAVSLSLVAASPALAQSGSVAGSALDPQTPNESLMPAGGFRLDGPADPSRDGSYDSLLTSGAGLGLQFYGSYNLDQQQPASPETENGDAPPTAQP